MDSYSAWHALTGEHECAPAQEEKEMDTVGRCSKCPSVLMQHEEVMCSRCRDKEDALTADFRERWDRAFFAALGAGKGVTMAQAHADTTIRRHAELMASRDAAIAEVTG